MALNVQVTCVKKSDRDNHHQHITHIGGLNADKTHWMLTQRQAVDGIEAGKWTFWVSVGGTPLGLIIGRSASGNRYLKTEDDTAPPSNLLALPECEV